jgi:hypothetical protein
MKTRPSIIGATLAILFAGNACATAHAADAASSMTVDNNAPVRALLLPTVSIDATSATSASNPARMRIANTAPVEVTLLPTVRVVAHGSPELAVTLLPTVRVTAGGSASLESEAIAERRDFAPVRSVDDDASPSAFEQPLGLRVRTMPR